MSQKKIIWAFDPYTDIVETWKRAQEAINLLNVDGDFEVEPVYVIGSDLLRWVGNVTPPQLSHIKPFVEKTLSDRLKDIKIKNMKAPEIIETTNTSRREDVSSFINYINSVKPELLVINTHARSGISRLFMGSFAENVLLHCTTPTLFVNPNNETVEKMDNVLFPTDFSEHSLKVYKSFINTYSGTVKKVLIMSKVLRPLNAFADAGVSALGGAWVAPEQFINQEKDDRTEDGKKWIELAKAKGIEAEFIVDDSLGNVVDSINELQQQKNVDFIAMSSESGPIESIVIGSIARSVIREVSKPVLICHGFDKK